MTRTPPYNLAAMSNNHDALDPEAHEVSRQEASARAKRREQEERDDLKWQMGSKRGRRIVYRLLERAGVFQISFNTNAMQMAFNEGRRNEGLALTNRLLAACPELWTQMMKEQAHD